MLPHTTQKPESLLQILSAKNTLGDATINSAIMEQEKLSASKTSTNQHQHQSKFNSHFTKQHSERSFRSLNSSGSVGSSGPGLLAGNRPNIPTSNIVNRALEVMSNSLKESDYTPRQPVKSVDDGDSEDDTEKDLTPSDSSNSDNDNDEATEPTMPTEPTSRLGNITAQLSFRKIAKKRRKAGGRSSFHHSKSSKEYLRKAQEAYQRLKISEQEQPNDQNRQPELENGRDSLENDKNQCKDLDLVTSRNSIKTREPEAIDYGYGDGDPSDKNTKEDAVDYGYGDTAASQPDQAVDYGYGDPEDGQPQLARREKPRRRNSVTKFSLQAANVVAAQAAAERILKLRPGLTSLSRSSTTPTRRRQQPDQPQRLNAKQNHDLRAGRNGRRAAMQSQQQENQKNKTDNMRIDRLEPPRRRASNLAGVAEDRGSVMQSSHLKETSESKHPQHENGTSRRPIPSTTNPHFQMTSDYFSSEPKQRNLLRKNSNSGRTFRFSTPARTSSWLSHDNSYSTVNNDDDDADSLASDMESLCSIRDGSYRLDTHHMNHAFKNTDTPPVLPTPPPAFLTSPPPDRRSRFTGGRSCSGELNFRNRLVASWSNGSNKEGSLSRFSQRNSRSKDFPILPCVRVVTTNGSASAFMPAPVNRTPSYKGSQQRQD